MDGWWWFLHLMLVMTWRSFSRDIWRENLKLGSGCSVVFVLCVWEAGWVRLIGYFQHSFVVYKQQPQPLSGDGDCSDDSENDDNDDGENDDTVVVVVVMVITSVQQQTDKNMVTVHKHVYTTFVEFDYDFFKYCRCCVLHTDFFSSFHITLYTFLKKPRHIQIFTPCINTVILFFSPQTIRKNN